MKQVLMFNLKISLIVVFILQITNCQSNKEPEKRFPFTNKREYDSVMVETHRAFLKRENALIESYIDSSGKDFIRTGTGLRYYIYEHANGDSIKSGDVVF